MTHGRPSIGAIALPEAARGTGKRRGIALVATVSIHGLLAAALILAPSRGQGGVERRSQPLHVVEIAAPPPPPPPPPEEPEPEPEPEPVRVAAPVRAPAPKAPAPVPTPAPEPAPAAAKAEGPVAPAQAGQVLAAEAEPEEILDFTGFDIATGDGAAYVGGVTSAAGTNTVAARGEVAHGGTVGAALGAKASQARSVQLPGRNWDCPWPADARAVHEREQEVVIRAVVRPDGSAISVEILSDPGHGFGEAARRCARAARFEPALDAEGRAVASTSPPIRVRFTR